MIVYLNPSTNYFNLNKGIEMIKENIGEGCFGTVS